MAGGRWREFSTCAARSLEHGAAASWEPEVLGIPKRQLLREVVLPALSTNRALQRLLAEYVEMLQSL